MTERTLNIYRDLVSTSGPAPRRKSPAELRAMKHEDRLYHEIFAATPMTEAEKQAELEHEDQLERYESGGEISIVNDRVLYDDGPPLDEDD